MYTINYYSFGEWRSKAPSIDSMEDTHFANTLTELSETVTLTFNDLIFPTTSSSIKSSLNSPPNQPSPNKEAQTSKQQDDTSTDGDVSAERNDPVKVLPNTLQSQAVDAPENPHLNHGIESNDSEEGETFTLTPSTALSAESPTHHRTGLDTTLQALDSSPQNQPPTQDNVPPKTVIKHVEHSENTSQPTEATDVTSSHQCRADHEAVFENSPNVKIDEHAVASAVRTEIRDILQLQQQHLLSLLKAMKTRTAPKEVQSTDCGTQIDLEEATFVSQKQTLPQPVRQLWSQDAQMDIEQPTEDIMPVSC